MCTTLLCGESVGTSAETSGTKTCHSYSRLLCGGAADITQLINKKLSVVQQHTWLLPYPMP